jgi:outer membrane murein-binding lipoprotein Lpp
MPSPFQEINTKLATLETKVDQLIAIVTPSYVPPTLEQRAQSAIETLQNIQEQLQKQVTQANQVIDAQVEPMEGLQAK